MFENNGKDITCGSLGFLGELRQAEGELLRLFRARDSITQTILRIYDGSKHFSHNGHWSGLPLQLELRNGYEPWNKLLLDARRK
jgi:hypothetical protein